jgi:MFS family permease
MLLTGLGVGALASQLGAVTVSAVPDEQSGEVGGLQNTLTNLGASIGTALAGAVLISALTSSFFQLVAADPAIEPAVAARAEAELTSGVPFVPDDDVRAALDESGVPADTADAVADAYAEARLVGLRAALAILALLALVAVLFTGRIPDRPPGG